jgi:hypothetical protein
MESDAYTRFVASLSKVEEAADSALKLYAEQTKVDEESPAPAQLASAQAHTQLAYGLGSCAFILSRLAVESAQPGAEAVPSHHPSRLALQRVQTAMTRVKAMKMDASEREGPSSSVSPAAAARIAAHRGRQVKPGADDGAATGTGADSDSSSSDSDGDTPSRGPHRVRGRAASGERRGGRASGGSDRKQRGGRASGGSDRKQRGGGGRNPRSKPGERRRKGRGAVDEDRMLASRDASAIGAV